MGGLISRLYERFRLRNGLQSRILMLGLDAAGKTTILYMLKLGEVVQTIPTIGFNVETVVNNNVIFQVWDTGHNRNTARLVEHYYPNTQGIIFVVDCCDRDRLPEAKEVMERILANEHLQAIPLLVLANKQDLNEAVEPMELVGRLGLDKYAEEGHPQRGRRWSMQGCVATRGEGLQEGLDWLAQAVQKHELAK